MLSGLRCWCWRSSPTGLFGGYASLALILGLILTGGSFILSVIGWDSRRTISGAAPEKRWRGQPITTTHAGPTEPPARLVPQPPPPLNRSPPRGRTSGVDAR